jgi:hypothetical protein
MKWILGIFALAAAFYGIFYYSQQLSKNDPAKAFMRRFHEEMSVLTTSADSVKTATKLIRFAEDSVRTLPKDSLQLMKDVVNTIWITNNNAQTTPDWTKEKILRTAEVQPQFPKGNDAALRQYLEKNINEVYWGESFSNTPGNIPIVKKQIYKVDFVVNLDGSIQDIIVEAADKNLEKVALKAITNMPKWKPGTYKGFDVRSHYRFQASVERS